MYKTKCYSLQWYSYFQEHDHYSRVTVMSMVTSSEKQFCAPLCRGMRMLTKCFGTCGSMDKTVLGLCSAYITTLRLTPVPSRLTQFVQQQKTTRHLRHFHGHFCVNNRHDTLRVFYASFTTE